MRRPVDACVLIALIVLLSVVASALVVTRVTVAATPTLIYTASNGGSSVLIRNPSGGQSIYLGTSAVTSSTGFEVVSGDGVTLPLGPLDQVWGIVASSTQVVHVLESRR